MVAIISQMSHICNIHHVRHIISSYILECIAKQTTKPKVPDIAYMWLAIDGRSTAIDSDHLGIYRYKLFFGACACVVELHRDGVVG